MDKAALEQAYLMVEKYADCGDNSCRFKVKGGGMRTNGGCRCERKPMVMAALANLYHTLRKELEK